MKKLLLIIAVAFGVFGKTVYAIPCAPQTIDNYTASGFSCTIADTWSFFDFDHTVFFPPESALQPTDVLVTPYGGTQRAGIIFQFLEPANTVAINENTHWNIKFTVQGNNQIESASMRLDGAIAGPPEGRGNNFAFVCPGALLGGDLEWDCPASDEFLRTAIDGSDYDVYTFDPVYLVDLTIRGFMVGGTELPGGARLDAFTVQFNTVPEPSSMAIMLLGLMGLSLKRWWSFKHI